LDLTPNQFTTIERFWNEINLSEQVGSVQLVEGYVSGAPRGLKFEESQLVDRDTTRGPYQAGLPQWQYTSMSVPGKISVFGDINGYTIIRIWFHRRFPGYHHGTARGTSTTTLTFDTNAATRVGDLVLRDDLYNGLLVEIDSDATQSSNVDAIRRIVSYTGGVATMDSAWPATTTTGVTTYSLVLPSEPEHANYIVQLCAKQFYIRMGNAEYLAAQAQYLASLEDRFKAGLSARARAPKRLWNRRGL
jgi:hypothetical protein